MCVHVCICLCVCVSLSFLFLKCVCICVFSLSVYALCAGAHRGQKRVTEPLDLELEEVVRTKSQSSARAVSALTLS